jgi:hypothetical protein
MKEKEKNHFFYFYVHGKITSWSGIPKKTIPENVEKIFLTVSFYLVFKL